MPVSITEQYFKNQAVFLFINILLLKILTLNLEQISDEEGS